MAASIRPTSATYTLHEEVTVDTTDNEDHTFSGVIFPVECKGSMPIDHMVITSVSVRGMLGPMTAWVTKEKEDADADSSDNMDVEETQAHDTTDVAKAVAVSQSTRRPQHVSNYRGSIATAVANAVSIDHSDWNKIYECEHPPSMSEFVELKFDTPIKLVPNQICGIYLHSKRPGDEAIVYDNQRLTYTHDDGFLRIRPGLAHLSNTPFGRRTIWGWGSPWRENREFVGRLSYGVVYKLWNPQEYNKFGSKFKDATITLLGCQRRPESPISLLSDDVIYYILNLCRWDWYGDTVCDFNNAGASLSASSDAEGNGCQNTVARGRHIPATPGWPPLPFTFLSSMFPQGSREAHGDPRGHLYYGDEDEGDEDSTDESWDPN